MLLIGGIAAYVGLFGPVRAETRQQIVSSLQNASCSWLNLDSLAATQQWGAVAGKLSGFAGDVSAVTNNAAQAAGIRATFDTAGVSAVGRQACDPLNGLRLFREANPTMTVPQSRFALENNPERCPTTRDTGRQARASVDLKLEDLSTDLVLLGFETRGWMQVVITGRKAFLDLPNVESLGNGLYRFSFCVEENTALQRTNPNGVVALVMVKGKGPFNFGSGRKPDVLGLAPNANDTEPVPAGWQDQFAAHAKKQGWQTEIVWYQIVPQ